MAEPEVNFTSPPPIGFTYTKWANHYELLSAEPYVRKTDGQQSTLLVWRSHCSDCGAEFTTSTPLVFASQVRRCKMHRQRHKPSTKEARKAQRDGSKAGGRTTRKAAAAKRGPKPPPGGSRPNRKTEYERYQPPSRKVMYGETTDARLTKADALACSWSASDGRTVDVRMKDGRIIVTSKGHGELAHDVQEAERRRNDLEMLLQHLLAERNLFGE